MANGIARFANDIKLFRVVITVRHICTLGECASKWQMPFNVRKGKVMHIGTPNCKCSYKLTGSADND